MAKTPRRRSPAIRFLVDDIRKDGPFGDLKDASPVDKPESMLEGWRQIRQEGLARPAPEQKGVVLEKRIGQFVALSSSLLHVLAERRRAVVRIVASGEDFEGMDGEWTGTGFLVADNLLLTNHHVINSPDVARTARAEFDYEIAPDALLAGQTTIAASLKSFNIDPSRLFLTSPVTGGLDYTFVWIDRKASEEFGSIPMERSSFTVKAKEQAFVIHHPDGRPKETSLDDADVLGIDSKVLHYSSDTEPGSSGAPIMDRQGRLIALHHASQEKDAVLVDGQTSRYVNEGIKIAAIAIDLERRAHGGGPDAALAREVLATVRGSDTLTGFFGGLGRVPAGKTAVEKVVNTYRGDDADIDIGFWNIEHLSTRYDDEAKLAGAARVIADMKLDAWGLSEISPIAIERLTDKLRAKFGEDYDYILSEPGGGKKQSTAVIWRRSTLRGTAVDWPASVRPLFDLDSRDPRAPAVEKVHGKIFDRYPQLVRLEAVGLRDGASFSLHVAPLHLKAMSEGSLRRRMAAVILRKALEALRDEGIDDVIVGGDVNAPLSSGDFDILGQAGYAALGAQDEQEGAFTYLKGPKSLIDNIFVSPNLKPSIGAEDFMVVARDREIGDFVRTISDHRPIMVRLSVGAAARSDESAADAEALVNLALTGGNAGDGARPAPARGLDIKAAAPEKITFQELKRRLRDPSVSEEELRPYLQATGDEAGPFRPRVVPNPERVILDDDARADLESALDWGNRICRWRRERAFDLRLALGSTAPVLVSEGDSWFQFPFLIDDVIDHLNEDFLIYSCDAAGDTADNMIIRNPEYMAKLADQKRNGVAGFLLSAAGNDVIGEDASGKAALLGLLNPFQSGASAKKHINAKELKRTLDFLEQAYRKVVATVRADADFRKLPIFIHGYDYAIPGGFPGDPRAPSWAAQDKWLGAPMKQLGIVDTALQRAIVRELIDRLYDMLAKVAGDSASTHVHLVDARGALGPIENWADEIHGTSDGYRAVAGRFRARISRVLGSA